MYSPLLQTAGSPWAGTVSDSSLLPSPTPVCWGQERCAKLSVFLGVRRGSGLRSSLPTVKPHIAVVIAEVNLVWSPRRRLGRHSINMSAAALKFDGRQCRSGLAL